MQQGLFPKMELKHDSLWISTMDPSFILCVHTQINQIPFLCDRSVHVLVGQQNDSVGKDTCTNNLVMEFNPQNPQIKKARHKLHFACVIPVLGLPIHADDWS